MISLCKINVSVRPRTYKPGIGKSYRVTSEGSREKRDYFRDLIS